MGKKVVKVLVVLIIMVLIVSGCGKKEKNTDNNKEKESNSFIIKGQTIDGLKIGNLAIVYENEISRIVTNVTNTNDTTYELRTIDIKLYDDKNNLLIETKGYIGTSIKPNETKQSVTEVTKNLKSATRVEYEIDK